MSHIDPFIVLKQQHEEFMKLISKESVVDIVGVVDASGVGGATSVASLDNWNLIIHFAGWRRIGEAMQPETLRVEMPVSRDDISLYLKRISPYDIIQVRGRVAIHPAGNPQALVQQIISTTVRDRELEMHAAELQKPVTFSDPKLGTFLLDRTISMFRTRTLWCGEPVDLNLSLDNDGAIDKQLQVAAEIWRSEVEWDSKVGEFASQKLLSLKNECWLGENESEIGPDQFKARMILETIQIESDGSFEFWLNDGDIFWGHSIVVKGILPDGLVGADIHG